MTQCAHGPCHAPIRHTRIPMVSTTHTGPYPHTPMPRPTEMTMPGACGDMPWTPCLVPLRCHMPRPTEMIAPKSALCGVPCLAICPSDPPQVHGKAPMDQDCATTSRTTITHHHHAPSSRTTITLGSSQSPFAPTTHLAGPAVPWHASSVVKLCPFWTPDRADRAERADRAD